MGNAILAEEKHQPIYKEIWDMPGRENIPGGSCLNSIRSCNFMLKDSHPGQVAYFGCIGKDEFGNVLEKTLQDSGIHSYLCRDETEKTGTCAVIVHEKERSLIANLAACTKFPLDHFKNNVQTFKDAHLIYTTAFFITSNYEALQ